MHTSGFASTTLPDCQHEGLVSGGYIQKRSLEWKGREAGGERVSRIRTISSAFRFVFSLQHRLSGYIAVEHMIYK